MLEYFTIKKVKKHRAEKAEKERLEKDKAAAESKAQDKNESKDVSQADKPKADKSRADRSKADKPKADKPKVKPAAPAPTIITTPAEEPEPEPFEVSPLSSPGEGPGDGHLGGPLLDHDDEEFIKQLMAEDAEARAQMAADQDETPPPLPPRINTPIIEWDSDASSLSSRKNRSAGDQDKRDKGKGKATTKTKTKEDDDKPADAKNKRFSFVTNLGRNLSVRMKPKSATATQEGLKPETTAVTESEASREERELARVLEDLQLSASENKAFSLSKDTEGLIKNFTQVLKDLANGVPTAYQDLVGLIDDRDGILERSFDKLPNGLKKLVARLPDQLTAKLAPELLAVAAEAQGLSAEEGAKAGLSEAAKDFFSPKNLQDLVTKPGAVAGLLKGIVNALKTRWPAFMGTNVLWAVAIFLLLSVFWYCHKRGREVRLEKEAADRDQPIDGSDRIEELPDDLQLPAARGDDNDDEGGAVAGARKQIEQGPAASAATAGPSTASK